MNTDFAQIVRDFAAKFDFNTLLWFVWGSFAALFVAAAVLCLALPQVRSASKRPFLCLVYAYTALTLALYLTVYDLQSSAFTAALFWLAGYILYGFLCALSRKKRTPVPTQTAACAMPEQRVSYMPAQTEERGAQTAKTQPRPAVRNNVRLEHAITVTQNLLQKNLGATDRRELEKLKNTLEVLKVKGTLSPAEGEILNENFNMLLKLMAKYNA